MRIAARTESGDRGIQIDICEYYHLDDELQRSRENLKLAIKEYDKNGTALESQQRSIKKVDRVKNFSRLVEKISNPADQSLHMKFDMFCIPDSILYLEREVEQFSHELELKAEMILERTPSCFLEAEYKLRFVCDLIIKGQEFDIDYFAVVAAECLDVMEPMAMRTP